MALFEARELHLRFGDRVVLENVSLAFEAGQLSGIMGPNGAGKTTCFNVLTGRYKPDRGRVLLEGRDITGRSPQEIARLGVARSFQLMNLFDEFSVFENIAIALPATRSARLRSRRRRPTPIRRWSHEAHDILDKRRAGRSRRRSRRSRCPTARGARWRSASRSPAGQSCCSSTSPPRASAATAARASPSSCASSRACSPSSSSSTTWNSCSRWPTRSRSSTGAR